MSSGVLPKPRPTAEPPERGIIAWMTRHQVAANLLMFLVFAGGAAAMFGLKQEVFPEFDLDRIRAQVSYPGASPDEVEQGVVLALEEAVRGLDGVKRVTASAAEGAGSVTLELLRQADPDRVLSDVKNAVDRITSFPAETEAPTVELLSPRRSVVSLVIAGEADMHTLQAVAERARSALLAKEAISQVEIFGVRPLEVRVEMRRETLEAYDLTLSEVAAQVRRASIDLPSGALDTSAGELLVRVTDRRRSAAEFRNIVLRGTQAGAKLRLGDVATVTDGYEETDLAYFFNGEPAVRLTAYRIGDETPTEVAAAVRAYAEVLRPQLPAPLSLAIWNDDSELLQARIDLLVRNAIQGLALVVLVLGLFLRREVALWVAVGIPFSFFGAFVLMQLLGISINMITLFALIITLGIVVDDAIVVSEHIYALRSRGTPPLEAAIRGAKEMLVPVTFSTLTTTAAFGPLFFVPGVIGKVFMLIPAIVISVLIFSLIESFFVLPRHLVHGTAPSHQTFALWRWIDAVQARVSAGLTRFTEGPYRRMLLAAVRARYLTLSVGGASLMVTLAAVASGMIPYQFFPSVEADVVVTSARLPYGAPIARTQEVRKVIEAAALRAVEESGGSGILRGIFTKVGEGMASRGPGGGGAKAKGSHVVSVELNLVPIAERALSTSAFAARWRAQLPELAGLESLQISAESGPSAGKAVDVQLTHQDPAQLTAASESLVASLRGFEALTGVESSDSEGKPQIDFTLKPSAATLGLSSQAVAQTLRDAFFGAEALREQWGRNERKVMVRLPKAQRISEQDLASLQVALPTGGRVPLLRVADLDRGYAPTTITREEGARVVNVSADLAEGEVSPRPVLTTLTQQMLPSLKQRFPGLESSFVGQAREQNESMQTLIPGFGFALFAIFALLALPFRSYLQPLIIMGAIPFGIVGAALGHVLLGYTLSIISMLGIIALSGVVVNDSLVYVDAVNRLRDGGMPPLQAAIEGGTRRLRPILLTSLTTFLGLVPMILETSMQARFMIPMAISLGFGSLFVTVIVLLLVPALYLIVEDLRGWLRGKSGVAAASVATACALLVALPAQATPPSASVLAAASQVSGFYFNPDEDHVVRVYLGRDAKLYGKVVWSKASTSPQQGRLILRNFAYNPAERRWEGGRIFAAPLGRELSAEFWPEGQSLKVRAYLGSLRLIRKMVSLKRVTQSNAPAGFAWLHALKPGTRGAAVARPASTHSPVSTTSTP